MKCDKFIKFDYSKINLFDEYTITKICSNNDFILDKKIPNEEKFDSFYLNIININFDTDQVIKFNILADYISAEKITPIQFNYNKKQTNINDQEILIFNIKEDQYLYYGIYDIINQYIYKNLLIKLVDEKIENFKLICLNYGLDLFFIGQTINNKIIYFYLSDFRKINNNIIKYEITEENYNDLRIINNEFCVCIKTKKKLIMISKSKRKEIKL